MQDGAQHSTAQYSSDNNFSQEYLQSLVHIVLGVLLVGQLQVDVGILGPQGVEQPVHHIGDLAFADIIALAPHAPGQGQISQAGELP